MGVIIGGRSLFRNFASAHQVLKEQVREIVDERG
jgi:hypothetical protein